jgi:hypothetical protein
MVKWRVSVRCTSSVLGPCPKVRGGGVRGGERESSRSVFSGAYEYLKTLKASIKKQP